MLTVQALLIGVAAILSLGLARLISERGTGHFWRYAIQAVVITGFNLITLTYMAPTEIIFLGQLTLVFTVPIFMSGLIGDTEHGPFIGHLSLALTSYVLVTGHALLALEGMVNAKLLLSYAILGLGYWLNHNLTLRPPTITGRPSLVG